MWFWLQNMSILSYKKRDNHSVGHTYCTLSYTKSHVLFSASPALLYLFISLCYVCIKLFILYHICGCALATLVKCYANTVDHFHIRFCSLRLPRSLNHLSSQCIYKPPRSNIPHCLAASSIFSVLVPLSMYPSNLQHRHAG